MNSRLVVLSRNKTAIVLGTFFAICGVSLGQTNPQAVPQPPNAELQKFEPFLGTYEVSGDFANLPWNGTLELKKVIKGWYIQQIIRIKSPGIDREFWVLSTWDKGAQKYRLWGFQTLPAALEGEIRFEGSEMITTWPNIRPDGSKVLASNRYHLLSKDQLEIVSYTQSENGPMQKIGTLVGKRMAKGDASSVADSNEAAVKSTAAEGRGLPPTVANQIGEEPPAVKKVLAADEARRQAMLHGDVRALDSLLADDVTVVWGDGTTDNKASTLELFRSGRLHYQQSDYENTKVRVFDDIAILTGDARVRAVSDGESIAYLVRVTRVYALRQDRWQLVSVQTTRAATSSEASLSGPPPQLPANSSVTFIPASQISPSPEMQKILASQVGTWSQHEERSDGTTGDGEATWWPGPGGMSLIENEFIRSSTGEMRGLSVTWYDQDARGYRALWCSNKTKNGCLVMSKLAHWEGDQFVLRDEFESNGKQLSYKEVESRITPTTYTLTSYFGEPGGELRSTSIIHATKISEENVNPSDVPAEAELRAFMAKLRKASIDGDVETVAKSMTDDYVQTDINGYRQDKGKWLNEYFQPLADLIKAGKFHWDAYERTNLQFQFYGDCAIVTGELHAKGTGAKFGPQHTWVADPNASFSGSLRFTHVYTKQNGKWMLAALHNQMPLPLANTAN